MTDRELYNHIKATYKPEKGTALFFDLRNYHICGLHPRKIESFTDLQLNLSDCSEKGLRAFISYFDDQILFDFSYTRVFQIEDLLTNKVIHYQAIRMLDDDELNKLFEQMISAIDKLKAS